MTGAEFLGAGIGFLELSRERPDLATEFLGAVESVAEQFELQGEGGVTAEPFVNWTFHLVESNRWVARMAPYRDTEPLYMEWNSNRGWDTDRVQSSISFLMDPPTSPQLRTRPRATRPREVS